MAEIRGVNLGGWFVLESWMKPELFNGLEDCYDETCFMKQQANAHERLIEHYETFIKESDFKYLKSHGVSHVRLPIAWWYQGTSLYQISKVYIEQALNWASKYDMQVLIDLHTAPGCQNGFDNGGMKGVMTWHLDQKHMNKTVDVLIEIVRDFKGFYSVIGFEVLNEPFVTINLDLILDFYEQAYQHMRALTDKMIVFHDAFRPEDSRFKSFFKDKINVAFDLHLYHCFDEKLIESDIIGHIDHIINKRVPMIQEISRYVRVIVGEWSLGLRKLEGSDDKQKQIFKKALAQAQLACYEHAFGYYFWSYKIESEDRIDWDFKRLNEAHIINY